MKAYTGRQYTQRHSLLMIQLLCLIPRLEGYIDAELLEHLLIDVGEDDGGVRLAALEAVDLVDSVARHRVHDRAYSQRHQHLIRVQARIVVAEVLDLEVLDRLDDARSDKLQRLVYPGKLLESVQQAGRGRAEQGAGLAGDDGPVIKLQRNGGRAGLLRAVKRCLDDRAILNGDAGGIHDKLDLAQLSCIAQTLTHGAGGGIVAADDLLL